jgi:uncharacterized membrane protein (DUF4010 family)
MTLTAILTATLASAAIGAGTWLAMVGAVTAATAGGVEIGTDRRHYRWFGIAMAVVGLAVFVVGAIVGLGTLA